MRCFFDTYNSIDVRNQPLKPVTGVRNQFHNPSPLHGSGTVTGWLLQSLELFWGRASYRGGENVFYLRMEERKYGGVFSFSF